MNIPTGLTWVLADLNFVLLDPHGRLDLPTGTSTFLNIVLKLAHVSFFRSTAKMVPPYNSSISVQRPSRWCPACCRPWSPRNISLLLTRPGLWKFPSLVCTYHFLSTRTGSSNVEAFRVTLWTRISPVEQCLALGINSSCAQGLTARKSLCYHDGSLSPKGRFPSGQMETLLVFP